MRRFLILSACTLGAILVLPLRADEPAAKRAGNPILASVDSGSSRLRRVLERYATDLSSLGRLHRIPLSPETAKRMKRFHDDWLAALGDVDFESLGQSGRIDYLLLRNELQHELRELDIREKRDAEILPLVPFWRTIVEAQDARRRMESVDPTRAAEKLSELSRQIHAKVPQTQAGDTVVVLGPGQQGLGCVVGALAAGAGRVFVTGRGRDARRLELARKLGAEATIDVDVEDPVEAIAELTRGGGADVVIDATAEATEPIVQAIEIARSRGTVILGGLKGFAEVRGLVTDKIVLKQLRLQGVGGHDSASIAAALELIASRRFPLHEMCTHQYPLERAEYAVRVVGREIPGEYPIHVTLIP